MGILDGIKKGGETLEELALTFGRLFMVLIVFAMIIGVFVYQATSGNITVGNTTNTTLTALETSYDTNVVTPVETNTTTIVGFIAIGVLLLLFGAWIYRRKGSSKSGDMM